MYGRATIPGRSSVRGARIRFESILRYCAVVAIGLLIGQIAKAQSVRVGDMPDDIGISSMRADFVRTVSAGNQVQRIDGTFYLVAPGHVYVEVRTPLRQILVVRGTKMLIYYPEDRRAFEFTGQGGQILPLISGLFAGTLPDYGLTAMGFKIFRQEAKADTILTYWRHPADTDDELGTVKLASTGAHLSFAEYIAPDEGTRIKTEFFDFEHFGSAVLPQRVTTTSPVSRGELKVSNVVLAPSIPASISNFKIPDGVPVDKRAF